MGELGSGIRGFKKGLTEDEAKIEDKKTRNNHVGISWAEFAIVAVFALIILGPKDFPLLLKNLGLMARKLKDFTDDLIGDINKEVGDAKSYIKDLDGNAQPTYEIEEDLKKSK